MLASLARANNICNSKWRFCAGIALVTVLLTYWPGGLFHLQYERTALSAGEIWRLWSAHLTHLNTGHLLLNLGGLFLICELLWHDLSIAHGLGILLLSATVVSGCLWFFDPDVHWYAGLSGVLHGLWAGCALASCRSRNGLAGLGLLAVKLLVEWRYGVAPSVAQLIGAPVISVAHFYGAAAGGIYLLLWKLTIIGRRKSEHA